MNRFARLSVIASVLLSLPVVAEELEVVWNDSAGKTVAEGVIKLPRRITQTHLDSLRLRLKDTSVPVSRTKGLRVGEHEITPTVMAGNFSPDLAVMSEANPGGEESDLVADWSGGEVHLKPTPEFVSSCYLYGSAFGGLVAGGQSFYVYVYSAMTVVAVVDVIKGDPDLYISDAFGGLVCSSTYSGKVPEDCATLNLSCGNSDLIVEVYGFKKKNQFLLGVWSTENY